jgi:hypothetical protein
MDISGNIIRLNSQEAFALQRPGAIYPIDEATELRDRALEKCVEYARNGYDEAANYAWHLARKFGILSVGDVQAGSNEPEAYEPVARCPQLSVRPVTNRRGFRRHTSELFY